MKKGRLQRFCNLWHHFYIMSTTGKFVEVGIRLVVTLSKGKKTWLLILFVLMRMSHNYTGLTITQPCNALYIQVKDWSLHLIFLLIWKTLKSCKQNKRYDSTSKHMVLSRLTQISCFPLRKPCGQPKASEYLSTPLYIARKELHLLSTLWKKKRNMETFWL